MKRCFAAFFLLAAFGLPAQASAKLVDESDGVFFPAPVASAVRTFKSFPVFWWNFAVLDVPDTNQRQVRAREVCRELKAHPETFSRVECGNDLSAYLPLATAWSRDVVLRRAPPSREELRLALDRALAQASLPLPPEVLKLLRVDPLGEATALAAHAQKRLKLALAREDGFFTDAAAGRVVIPVLPNFPPEEALRLAPLRQSLADTTWIGPHAATLDNRDRIRADLDRVSVVGTVVLVLLAAFLFFRGQGRLVAVLPPVFAGTALAAGTIQLVFGSVHGIVLAFGVGIIGLTIDYGLHLAYSPRPERVWRSNFAGFVTTMACLLVLSFSAVPLMRQLMIFSALGFAYAYFFLWAAQRLAPSWFRAEPMTVRLRGAGKRGLVLTALLVAGSVLGLFIARPILDLRSLEYQTARTATLTEWFFAKSGSVRPLFEPVQGGLDRAIAASRERDQWREKAAPTTRLETPADYVPLESERIAFATAWHHMLCDGPPFVESLPANHRKFFAPFLEAVRCEQFGKRAAEVVDAPYLAHLKSGGDWLLLWLPSSDIDAKAIAAHFDRAQSLFELVSAFPRLLTRELAWMFPLSLVLVFSVLWRHFGSAKLAALGLLPFAAGTGAVFWHAVLIGEAPSFVTIVGLVMMLGLSVDYAIFVVDFLRHSHRSASDEAEENGAGTALWLSALTTVLGFLPLVFCQHPVLAHLGWTLVLGTLGTVAAAVWGLPALRRWIGVSR